MPLLRLKADDAMETRKRVAGACEEYRPVTSWCSAALLGGGNVSGEQHVSDLAAVPLSSGSIQSGVSQ